MNRNVHSWAIAIALLTTTGCGRATIQDDVLVSVSASSSSVPAVEFGEPVPTALVVGGVSCAGGMELLSSWRAPIL